MRAIEQRADDGRAKRRQLELTLEQARFEAARAQRQFDAVDRGNRLVAGELERRWNERLALVSQRQEAIDALVAEQAPAITPQQREALLALGTDLPQVWGHPAATSEVRKRILRIVIKEIVARVGEGRIELVLHWQGGDHTDLSVMKNRTGQHRWTANVEVQTLVSQLARQLNDGSIASLLNRLGHRTGGELTWTQSRVRSFRCAHDIGVFKVGEREERGGGTLEQAADALGTSNMTVLRMITAGTLNASQARKGAPWVIKRCDLQRPEVRAATQPPSRRPLPEDPRQIPIEYQ
ncbi:MULTISPECIES: helix-turn-helix domain-containing protein [unclassified Variovorax]|uniref:helix-turn-helix domain-containing protein n=1 Tax=unclassified Variovorax TaxID=663243 RepID=UPI001BD53756|nr:MULTISPECIES: helix-turn-helix domain-containing protein [unclassified Variovorax]